MLKLYRPGVHYVDRSHESKPQKPYNGLDVQVVTRIYYKLAIIKFMSQQALTL